LQAPKKTFNAFDPSAHMHHFEEPEKFTKLLKEKTLSQINVSCEGILSGDALRVQNKRKHFSILMISEKENELKKDISEALPVPRARLPASFICFTF
jgi:hypothetical protein